METSLHHDAEAADACVKVSFPSVSTATLNPAAVAPPVALEAVAQRQGVARDTLPPNALCSSPSSMTQVPLLRLEAGVETAASVSTSVLSLNTATATTTAAARASSHSHPHLLHIIQQQQERIATLHASLERAVKSAQRSCAALESLHCKPHVPTRTGRIHTVGAALSSVNCASSSSCASIAEVMPAVATTVRWTDSIAATPMSSSPVSRDSITEWKGDSPPPECSPHVPSSSFIAPPTCSVLPVILLDITSMFTTRSTGAVAAAAHLNGLQSPVSTHRRCSDTQTDSVATESTTSNDKVTGGSRDMTGTLVDQLRGELAEAQRRLQTTEGSVKFLRARMFALQKQCCGPGASSCESADIVFFPDDSAGTSSRRDPVCRVGGASCPEAAAEYIIDGDVRKDMEELRRLRLLLRFSELKKDSDRLAGVVDALHESSAAQLHLQKRCDRLEHEKAQGRDCLRAIASCIERTLAASGKSTTDNRSDDSTAAAAAPSAMPDESVSVLKYVLRLCTDLVLSSGPHTAPLPLLHSAPLQARQSPLQRRQDRLHRAVSDSRDVVRPLPCRPPSRKASWRDPSATAAAAARGERRASEK
ncbi:hypothetical protein Q4I32_000032 [Leishmania shawi]|uniref:Uncharacterized protein n=2 Tax=Leishmania guyanensis species complex TaxID=38579 RepID=A0AAW3CC82_9TRYP